MLRPALLITTVLIGVVVPRDIALAATPPAPLTNVAAGSVFGGAYVLFTPSVDQPTHAVVRFASGTTPPATPTSGNNAGVVVASNYAHIAGLFPGVDYAVSAFAQDDANNTSTPVSVQLLGTEMTATAAGAPVRSGDAVQVSGVLSTATLGQVVADRSVSLVEVSSLRKQVIATKTTSEAGSVVFNAHPTVSSTYYLLFDGHLAQLGSISTGRDITVTSQLVLHAKKTHLAAGAIEHLTGRLSPGLTGQRVLLQQRTRNGWQKVDTATTRAHGAFGFTEFAGAGKQQVRAVVAATGDFSAGHSPAVTLHVNA